MNFNMSRIVSVALSIFLMCFIALTANELVQSNFETTKFMILYEKIKNNDARFLEMISMVISRCIELFLKTPRFLREYESRYDCSEINIPIHEILIEAVSKLFGYDYTAFNPWNHCIIYDHEIEVLNPEYGKLIFPNLINTSRLFISLATTAFCIVLMLIASNNWLREKVRNTLKIMKMIKKNAPQDDYSIQRAMSHGMIGVNIRFKSFFRQVLTATPYQMKMHHPTKLPGILRLKQPSNSEQRMARNADIRNDTLLHYQIPICVFMKITSLKSISSTLVERDHRQPVSVDIMIMLV